MNVRRPNARIVPNNFRLQTLIDEELAIAKNMETQTKLTSEDCVNIALAYLEVSDKANVAKYASMALIAEQSQQNLNQEILATAHYALATEKREMNKTEEALAEFQHAMNLAQSDWLKSNLLRNIGLVYLKEKKFARAADVFKQALDFTMEASLKDVELRGSLPALSNYYGLCLTRAAIQAKQDPSEGLNVLEETTEFYEKIFAEKKIPLALRQKSNDWQSHQFHRGMILCEIAEQLDVNSKERENKFHQAEKYLLGALFGRTANGADDQRLADTSNWIARVYVGLNQVETAKIYFEKTLAHYQEAFPGKVDAPQIVEVKTRLVNLQPKELKAPAAYGQGVFTAAVEVPKEAVLTPVAVLKK